MPKVTKTRTSPRNPPESRAAAVSRGSSARRRKNGKTYGKRGRSKSGDDLFSPINSIDIEDGALNEEEELEEEVDDIDEEDLDDFVEGEDVAAAAAAIIGVREGARSPEQENQDRNTDGDDDDDDASSDDEEGLLEELYNRREFAEDANNEGGEEDEAADSDDASEGGSAAGRSKGGEEDEAADSDDASAGGSAVGQRQSKRIKEMAKRQSKHLKQTKNVDKKVGKDVIKLGENWDEYTIASLLERFKNVKGFYVAQLPDGTFKFGYIYTEGQTPHCLHVRLRQLTSTIIGALWVRFLDTGDALSEQGVRMMETIAKFSFFVRTTTNEDGVVQSCSCGAFELFNTSRALCDDLLVKLYHYARDGKFRLDPGNGNRVITNASVENKTHPKWRDYVAKTSQGHHRNNCPWRLGDVNGLGAAFFDDVINYRRDPNSTCLCTKFIAGIRNIGNTCYFGAMLQIVFCVPDFLGEVNTIYSSNEDYDEEEEEEEVREMPLTKALLDVATTLGLLGDGDAEVADPTELKAIFDAITQQMIADGGRNPSEFAAGIEHDPHELWVCFFDIWKEEHPQLKRLINDYFFLQVEKGRECDECGDLLSREEGGIHPLSVAIVENAEDEQQSIQDLVDNHFQNEGNVAFHHRRRDGGCGEHTTAILSKKITTCPKALLVHIMRFDAENQKNEARIHLTDTLSLPHHEEDNDNCNYRLCGVLNHIGGSVNNGHCTAITKNGDQWIHYNDAVGARRSISFFTENEYKQTQCYMALYIQ